jgi:hypothetical protein
MDQRYLKSASTSAFVIDIFNPQLAEATHALSSASTGSSILLYTTGGYHSTATAYDGLVLFPATGTFTGTYAVYGYSKTV